MNKHVIVSIGNTDNKLTQQEWARFVDELNILILNYSLQTHFFGGSINWAKWQNVAWLFEVDETRINVFMTQLALLRAGHNQDSAFFLCGEGMFI